VLVRASAFCSVAINATQSCQEMAQAAVGPSQAQITQQGCGTKIKRPVAIATSFLCERTRQEALAHAASPITKMFSWLRTQVESFARARTTVLSRPRGAR